MNTYTGEEIASLRSHQIDDRKRAVALKLCDEWPSCWTQREALLAEQLRHFAEAKP